MVSVLITGKNGFVGSNLLSQLSNYSSHFQVVDGFDILGGDLANWNIVNNLPKSDIIVHLAAKSFIPDSFENPRDFYYNNIISTINILEKARLNNSKIIFFSTYVYGNPLYLPTDENHPTSAMNPYSQTKLVCEDIIKAYSRDFGVKSIIFRPFNIYGSDQKGSFIVPTILNKLKSGKIELNDPRPKRDFIHINDVVNAIILSLNFDPQGCEVFNIGTGTSSSLKNLIDIVIKVYDVNVEVIYSNIFRQGEVLDTVADINKIRTYMNWKPTISLMEGIELIKNK